MWNDIFEEQSTLRVGKANGVTPLNQSIGRIHRLSVLGRVSAVCVYAFERVMPDPFIFAVILTFLTAVLAYSFVPRATAGMIARGWYDGIFNILTFAFQVVLMLTAGHALASSRPVHAALQRLAGTVKTSRGAVSLLILVSLTACWIHWGFGLVTAALLAREIAKRVRVDFGWLVAAAYTGHVVAVEGMSGTIALAQATPGSALNLVEKTTGHILPLSQSVFAPFTLAAVGVLFVVLPIMFRYTEPAPVDAIDEEMARIRAEDAPKAVIEKGVGLGAILDRTWAFNVALAVCGCFALEEHWRHVGFALDLNSVILMFLLLGLLFHWTPLNYSEAVKHAAKSTGGLILQYPLYGGIMGMMTATGLAATIANAFIRFSSASSLPFFTYLSSIVITFLIPSGGGHWAVQGPFVLPAAQNLHSSMAATTMAVAMGESVANMIQPFFALPVLAIAGIGMRRMMGFMVITFITAFVVFGLSLLLLAPKG